MNANTGRARARLWAFGVATSALMLASGAHAQQTVPTTSAAPNATDERVSALEREIEALAAQIADLKQSTASNIDDLRATQTANATTLANGRPTIATGDGQQRFAVRTVVQFDAARYDEKGNRNYTNDLSSGYNFRRARLGVEGTFAKDWNYNLTGEFGGSGGEAAQLNQAYVEYAGWKPFGLVNPLRLRIGAWATPTGLEDGINNTDSLFLERPAIAELVRNIAGGDGRTGAGVLANGDHWYAHAVLTGAVVNGANTTALGTPEFDEQTSALLRLAYNPIYSPDYNLHVGVSYQSVFDAADTAAGAANTKAVRLRERPELRVDGTRLVDTGNIAADGVSAYGAELGFQWKNALLYGEYFKIDVDRTGALFDPSFDGWYVAGSWALTGENHPYVPATGGFRGIRPAKNFNPANGSWGAWELAARYSTLNLNDGEGVSGSPVPAGGIRGGEQNITTAGINWYPNNVFRFILDYQWIDVEKFGGSPSALAGAPANTLFNEDVEVVSLRSQFSF
jgi:phosphate-selective porin OprO and OprP